MPTLFKGDDGRLWVAQTSMGYETSFFGGAPLTSIFSRQMPHILVSSYNVS